MCNFPPSVEEWHPLGGGELQPARYAAGVIPRTPPQWQCARQGFDDPNHLHVIEVPERDLAPLRAHAIDLHTPPRLRVSRGPNGQPERNRPPISPGQICARAVMFSCSVDMPWWVLGMFFWGLIWIWRDLGENYFLGDVFDQFDDVPICVTGSMIKHLAAGNGGFLFSNQLGAECNIFQ